MNQPVVKNIIIINILLFIATFIASKSGIDLDNILGLFYFKNHNFRPYQLVTHLFMHADIWHLFFNMYAFWMFGRILEMYWGSKRFFTYYIITGLGAAFIHLLVNWVAINNIDTAFTHYLNHPTPETFDLFIHKYFPGYYNQIWDKLLAEWKDLPNNKEYIRRSIEFGQELITHRMDVVTVGASGAVYGVLLAFGWIFPNMELMLLFPPMPVKAKWVVIFYGGIELYMGIANHPGDNVAHFAHLGGMLFGILLLLLWRNQDKNNSIY